MTVTSSRRDSEPHVMVVKAWSRAINVSEELMTISVPRWNGCAFAGCDRATAIPPVDSGKASCFVTMISSSGWGSPSRVNK